MIVCAFCQKTHVHNTLYCDECGTYLLDDDIRDTQPLNPGENPPVSYTPSKPADYTASHLEPDPVILCLKIRNNRKVEILLDKSIYLGRQNKQVEKFVPDIDLSTEGVSAKSVSRRHAKISQRGNVVIVEDQDSINGTFINSKKLAPYLPEALNSGDTLRLGMVSMEVRILTQEDVAK